jgi:tetratricopeptide (TPR) repeat protein
MMRFHTSMVGVLAALLVVPALLGQGQIATLQDALSGTKRAIEVLKGLEQRLKEEPAAALGLILSATETPSGDEGQRDQRLESLRNEVNLLQMELDAMQSPMLAPDGAVQSALGASGGLGGAQPLAPAGASQAGVTTGLDDSMRALLSGAPEPRAPRTSEAVKPAEGEPGHASGAADAYSADPLRHGITCYRAGRYAEAYELLAPIDDATALYWQARTLERLERLDDAIQVMERAIAKGGEGFEQRRAQTDLEFLRWKRDFVKGLPKSPHEGAENDAPAKAAPRKQP